MGDYCISWRDVFDGSNKWYGHIDYCFDVVKQTGYKYFTWNGLVYMVTGDLYQLTQWKVNNVG